MNLINPYILGGGAPPVPGFSPNDIASVWAWSEADFLTGYADGAVIPNLTVWPDQSGNGRNGVLAGATNFETNEANGRPAVRTSGGQGLGLPSMAALTAASAYLVMRVDGTYGAHSLSNGSGGASHYPYSSNDIYLTDFRGPRVGPFGSKVPFNSYHLYHVWSKTNDWGFKQNASLAWSEVSNAFVGPASPALMTNGFGGITGKLAAWYFFTDKLSPADDEALRGYIGDKYGLLLVPIVFPGVAWWKGEGNAEDYYGVCDGVVGDNTAFAAGYSGNCFSFPGLANQGVALPPMIVGGTYSIDLMFKPANNSASPQGIFGVHYSNPGLGALYYMGTNEIQYHQGGAGMRVGSGSNSITVGAWNRVTLTHDPADHKSRLYINGVLAGTEAGTHVETFDDAPSIVPTVLPGSVDIVCLIDDVKIYNTLILP